MTEEQKKLLENWRNEFPFKISEVEAMAIQGLMDLARLAQKAKDAEILEELKDNWEPAFKPECEEEKGFQKGLMGQAKLTNKKIEEIQQKILNQ